MEADPYLIFQEMLKIIFVQAISFIDTILSIHCTRIKGLVNFSLFPLSSFLPASCLGDLVLLSGPGQSFNYLDFVYHLPHSKMEGFTRMRAKMLAVKPSKFKI